MKKKSRIRPRRRASALAFALIITACLAVCAGALLTLSGSEHKLTMRRIVVCEARNAAESAINFGMSQIVRMSAKGAYVTENFLRDAPLAAPGGDKLGPASLTKIDSARVTLLGGRTLSSAGPVVITSSVTDGGGNHRVFAKTIPLLTSVTVDVPGGDPVTVYAQANIVVCDDPLFNYAIFYNSIPLEMAPGGGMVIGGDIHSNSDIFLANNIAIAGSINSAGKIVGGSNPTSNQNSSPGKIYVGLEDKNGNGVFDWDPTKPSSLWNYNANRPDNAPAFYSPDKDAELINLNIVGANGKASFLDDSPNNPDWKTLATTVTQGNMQDSAQGVTPVMPPSISAQQGDNLIRPPVFDTKDPAYNADTENAKYANKAGLYLLVEPGGTVTAFQNSADAGEYQNSPDRQAWKDNKNNLAKILDLTSANIVSKGASFNDAREKKTVTPVDLDIANLRDYVANKSVAPAFSNGAAYRLDTPVDHPTNTGDTSNSGWNGVVYVQVENPLANLNKPTDSSALTAVRIKNADEVPNRAATNPAGATGFTLATNAPLYTVGNVNADGDSSTGSNSLPDTKNTAKLGKECPVSLAADAITTLSANWSDTDSGKSNTPGFTEISAALTVGVVKSTKSSYSGGIENFPRLLERWTGKPETALRIRGSMAALYESHYATGKWRLSGYYAIPFRDWGFSKIFADGYYPPGTPVLRSYRRLGLRYISAQEYADENAKGTWTLPDNSTTRKFPWGEQTTALEK